jgi:tRNA(fMet)-specific endonuclease VapC
MSAAPRYMLDTNIASYIIRGPSPALAVRLRAVPMAQICVSSITQGELLYGLARKPDATNLQIAVREFLARVEVLGWDSRVATRYGVLRAALEAGGTPLGNLDTLIAAHALTVDAVLVSNDQAFARVPALVVENWAGA